MCVQNSLRLRQSVGIVQHEDKVEFFKANVRESVSLNMNFKDIAALLKLFNGSRNIKEVAEIYQDINTEQLDALAKYLKSEFILIEQDVKYPAIFLSEEYRLINLLEDYFHTTSGVIQAIEGLINKTVMIIGLGAVGSYIATYLSKIKVGELILVDRDTVDISNLHRQYFFESDLGQSKAIILKEDIGRISPSTKVRVVSDNLDKDFFRRHRFSDISLIINCADEPSVDETSKIIAEYAMLNKVPHIVGGGYNLHLTLVGQTIIPFETACFKCFDMKLNELNTSSLKNVRKLHHENRKVGSFPPLSGMAASLASLDAFKILIESFDTLQQTNRRIEFNLGHNNFNVMEIERNSNCEWCGI